MRDPMPWTGPGATGMKVPVRAHPYKRHETEPERALHEPAEAKKADRATHRRFHGDGVRRLVHHHHQWKGREHDRELGKFDTGIEGEQAAHGRFARQSEPGENIGKAEAVDEPEDKRQHPAMRDFLPPQILGRHVHDRGRHGALDETARQRHDLQCGQDERDAVGDGE